jgi:hypothetical protein
VTVNLEELPTFGRPNLASNTLFGPRDMRLA